MKEIILTRGFKVQVDDWNYDWLMKWKWYVVKGGNTWYAARTETINNKRHTILMHRVINNTPNNLNCDHKDCNGLNCLESNLRNATNSQNTTNRVYKNKIGYRGVVPVYNRFHARISVNRKKIYLGAFETAILAAKQYDIAAKKYHGEFAILNFN